MNTSKAGGSERQSQYSGNGILPHKSELSAEERHHHIAEAAYYIAEQREFASGHELDDWLQAESVVNNSLQ